MKRITILAQGSHGDVQPFIALAFHLHRAGYRVRMIANEDFAPLIDSYGLDYVPLASNVQTMVNSPKGQAMIHTGNTLAALRYFMTEVQHRIDDTQWAAWQACQESDALVYSGIAMSGASIAEKLGIPSMSVFMIPAYPTRDLPVPQGNLPDWPIFNAALYGIFIELSWLLFRNAINRFRRRLDLSTAPWGYKHLLNDPRTPILLAYSEHILPRPSDWPSHIHICGYWFLPPPPNWTPPQELLKFLEVGSPPIYIGFGSMADRNAEAKTRAIIEAIVQTGQRAILSKGWGGLNANELPKSIFMCDYVPHEWLFERVSMVIHHGGAGTTAAGLRAGISSLLVPHFGDQFFWGRRVRQLGAGPRPIPAKQMDAQHLVNTIQTCLHDTSMQERAAALGKQIRAEDGLRNATTLMERTFEL